MASASPLQTPLIHVYFRHLSIINPPVSITHQSWKTCTIQVRIINCRYFKHLKTTHNTEQSSEMLRCRSMNQTGASEWHTEHVTLNMNHFGQSTALHCKTRNDRTPRKYTKLVRYAHISVYLWLDTQMDYRIEHVAVFVIFPLPSGQLSLLKMFYTRE